MQVLGWLGIVLIGFAAIPQTIKVVRQGHGEGLVWPYVLGLWLGFFFMFWFSWFTHAHLLIASNYALQWVLFGVMIYVKRWPRVAKVQR